MFGGSEYIYCISPICMYYWSFRGQQLISALLFCFLPWCRVFLGILVFLITTIVYFLPHEERGYTHSHSIYSSTIFFFLIACASSLCWGCCCLLKRFLRNLLHIVSEFSQIDDWFCVCMDYELPRVLFVSHNAKILAFFC